MKESPFVNIFFEAAKQVCGKKYQVESKSNLYYELFLDRELEPSVKQGDNPKRGYGAFQVDLCIYEKLGHKMIPRIAIEFKKEITTHDVLTYSAKAGKHKSIYPGLRYGLIASELEKIPQRFFVHNEHIDFFIAGSKYKTDLLKDLIKKLIKNEMKISKTMDDIYFEGKDFDYYRTNVIISNVF